MALLVFHFTCSPILQDIVQVIHYSPREIHAYRRGTKGGYTLDYITKVMCTRQ